MTSIVALLLGRPGASLGREPVARELVRLLALLGAASLALAVGYTAVELSTARKERLLHDFHRPAILLTSAIYGTYAGARSPVGIAPRAERGPGVDAAFVAQMHVAYDRILRLGEELLALYARHRESPFDTGAARLNRSLRQIRELHRIADRDEREFAEALASSDLSISLVLQQLERLHQGAAAELSARISETRVVAQIVYAAVVVALLALTSLFGRRSLQSIWALLENERRAKEALLVKDQAMATSITPLAITDSAERLVYVNPAFLRLWGFAGEAEALGRSLRELTSGEAMGAVRAALRGPGSWQGELTVARADGSHVEVLLGASAVAGESGALAYVMVSALDLAERRRLEAQLLQAQKMESIGRLAGGVAHDFNNLLTGINGSVVFALEQLPEGSPVREALSEIKEGADSAAHLVRQLLAFSRRQLIQPRIVSLNDVIAGVGKMLPRLLGEEIVVRVKTAPGLGRVRLDPGQAEQILMNLAVNARDAMPDGGELAIESSNVTLDDAYCARNPGARPGPCVMVAVSDTGTGMTPEVKARIFEPFFTTKPKGLGTGLGLASVYGVVKQNEGAVEVHSEPGRGSTFKIFLPRVDGVVEAATGRADRPAGGAEVIFLVEDDERVRAVAQRTLVQRGYAVHAFAGGPDAIAALASVAREPALLITDVVLGGMNGGELAGHMKGLVPGIKVMFASGYTEDVVARHGVLDEGIEFVPKPYTPDVLARRVREVLDRSA